MPLKGMDSDTDYSLLSPEKALFIKNGQVLYNKKSNGSVGSNQLALTPLQSNETDFDETLLPRIRTYTIDLTALDGTYPINIFSYTKDYYETIDVTAIDDLTELQAYFTALGFTNDGNYVFTITGEEIWMSVLFQVGDNTQQYEFEIDSYGDYVGVNYCIGTYYHRTLNQMYWFNYNTQGRHHILMRADEFLQYYKLYETPILNFSYTEKIAHVDLVQVNTTEENVATQRLLYWTDGVNPPRKVNVDKCLSGEYWDVLPLWYRTQDEWMRAVKYPPNNRIEPTIYRDNTILFNNIINRNFQFRYRFLYDDGEASVYSPISTLSYTNDSSIAMSGIANAILLDNISAGSKIVSKIEVCFRIGNTTDFKTFSVISKEEAIDNALYNYNQNDNTFSIGFINNYAYSLVPPQLSNKLYDVHPIKALAQTTITNNTLAYGNILEGYDNLVEEELQKPTIDIEYNDIGNSLDVSYSIPFNWFSGTSTNSIDIELIHYNGNSGIFTVVRTDTIISNTTSSPLFVASEVITDLTIGDTVYLRVNSIDYTSDPSDTFNIGTPRTFSGVYTSTEILDCGSGDFAIAGTSSQPIQSTDNLLTIVFNEVSIDSCDTIVNSVHYTPYNTTPPHLKQGGSYQFGFVLFDEALRSTFVQTNVALKLNVKSAIELQAEAKAQNITFDFNGCVFPNWVKYVSIYRTKNQNINRENGLGFIQWKISNPTIIGDLMTFNLVTLSTFNTDNLQQTSTTYTFTDGDICRFITIGGAANIATDIIDRQLKSTDSITLAVVNDNALSSLQNGDIIEIYTPQQERQTELFYEITPLIPTTGVQNNNQPTQSTVTLNTFDTYYIDRGNSFSAYSPFESPSRSDQIINSHGEDIGRLNIVNPTAKQVWKPALVRYSFVFDPESFINGLSTFDTSRDRMYWRQFGGITSLVCIKNELHVIQENNVFKSSIGRSQVQYADGSLALIGSNQIISDIFDTVGDYGCQNAATVIEKDGFIYYWDVKRGVVVRYDGNKQEPISFLGQRAYITEVSKNIIQDISKGLEQISLVGGYCPKYNYYMITGYKNYPSGRVDDPHIDDSNIRRTDGRFTLKWDMDNQFWSMFTSYLPEYYSYMDGSQLGVLLVTFRYGVPYYHNKDSVLTYNTFYGTECNQTLEVVVNKQAQSVKNYITSGYDSDYAYGVEQIETSIKQTSQIPIQSFVKKEGTWWSNFYRATSFGSNLITGEPLKGNWIRMRYVKDRNNKTKYNELRRLFTNFTTSAKTLR
jgi:hypothetical protein